MLRRFLIGGTILALVALSGCAPSSVDDSSPEDVARVTYVPEGPPSLTVFTVVNNQTGSGGHSSLMVSGSEQVIYDPAGSFRHRDVVERRDVLYGMSPKWVAAYKSAHARDAYHIVSQTVTLTPEQAETALALVKAKGAAPPAFCANNTSSILQQVPGFEDIDVTFYPVRLMEQVEKRPDVVTTEYFENDAGDVVDGIVPIEG